MKRPAVLLAEGNEVLRRDLRARLIERGFEVTEASSREEALRAFRASGPGLVIVASSLEDAGDGLEAARQIRRWERRVPLILLASESSEELAIAAIKAGVTDYFKPPFALQELAESAARCLASGEPKASRPEADLATPGLLDGSRLIGESRSMREIRVFIVKVAPSDSTVLLTGETGTGKELAAELIHRNSPRRHRAFVCINCAAIPDTLLESELFGYERGAFTGAHALREGKLKLADGGTAFFDEIGDMSPYAQAKILRAIETKEVQRLGGRGTVPLDIRVIAATNQDVERLVAEQKFRRDLYFRLHVARINLPPLRDRKEDIPRLFDHYIRESNRRFGLAVEGFTDEALESLLRYPWPGNVRELKNLVEAVFLNRPPRRIALSDLPEELQRRLRGAADLPADERERLLCALLSTNWNKSKAAQKLHWSRMTVYRKMTKYQISRTCTVTSAPTGVTGP